MESWGAPGRDAALANVDRAVRFDRELPERVFHDGWCGFLFFEAALVRTRWMPGILDTFLAVEKGAVCCLCPSSHFSSRSTASYSAAYVHSGISSDDYCALLSQGGPVHGLLYALEPISMASDVGRWAIYTDPMNDVGIVGFRGDVRNGEFDEAISGLRALPLTLLMEGPDRMAPYDKLVPYWREGLATNYQQAESRG